MYRRDLESRDPRDVLKELLPMHIHPVGQDCYLLQFSGIPRTQAKAVFSPPE